MKKTNIWYSIGKRDAIAELFMQIRLTKNPVKVIKHIAKIFNDNNLIAFKENHPHAKWIIENL